MTDRFTLPDTASARDLSVLLGRAARLDDAGAVRLIGGSGVLAVYVAVITPRGLLDRSPTVLGLRTFAMAEGSFDIVVPIRSLTSRVDARLELLGDADGPVEVGLPTPVHTVVWAAISPPRGGWQRMRALDPAPLETVAREGIEEVASAVPQNIGQQIVDRVRAEVWGRPIADDDHLPAGAAFAAVSLGFLGEDPVQQFASGPWIRLTTRRGHVLVKPAAWSIGG